jgi:hypothetical protein
LNIRSAPAHVGSRVAAEDFGDDVLGIDKIPKAGIAGISVVAALGKIAIKVLRRPILTGSIDFAAVEASSLGGIVEQIISRGYLLEQLFGLLVSRIQVRMQLLGELAIGLLDVLLRRIGLHTQDRIRISCQLILPSCADPIPRSRCPLPLRISSTSAP